MPLDDAAEHAGVHIVLKGQAVCSLIGIDDEVAGLIQGQVLRLGRLHGLDWDLRRCTCERPRAPCAQASTFSEITSGVLFAN